jgi:hypothetical protein
MSYERQAMLNAYHGEWNKENTYQLKSQTTEELCDLIDRLSTTRPVSSYRGGASGDHAWIILSDHGFNLEVYFGEGTRQDLVVRFVLYGPYEPGETTSIYDGRGLFGDITTDHLKGLLALLDQGSSPLDFVNRNAIEVSVVTD